MYKHNTYGLWVSMKFDTIINVDISCSSHFAVYLEEYLMSKHHTYVLWVSMIRKKVRFHIDIYVRVSFRVITWVPLS